MLPALTVTVFPVPVGIQNLAVPIGKSFTLLFEVAKPVQKICSSGISCVEPVAL